MITGIDVSSHNGAVDWSGVATAGHRFAYIKASEGLDYRDASFPDNWGRAGVSSLLRGAYHYARPQPESAATDEAAWFAEVMHGVGAATAGHLPPAVALTSSWGLDTAGVLDWAGAFIDELRRLTGRVPVVYAGRFWKQRLGDPVMNWGCPLWLAQYSSSPALPAGWANWLFWQSAQADAAADARFAMNQFEGAYQDLASLASGQ